MERETNDPREVIYDQTLYPLIARIQGICKEHKIAHVLSFEIGKDDDGNEVRVNSGMWNPGDSQTIAKAIDLITEKPVTFGLTIYKTPPAP